MPTDLARIVAEKMPALPLEKQQRVLEFVESIEQAEKQPEINKSSAGIDERSAIEAVEKILQDNDFPDRFSVLHPKREEDKWRVPVVLTYPKYEPVWLADVFVDAKTGKVEMSVSLDELLKKGKRKAKEVFSIA